MQARDARGVVAVVVAVLGLGGALAFVLWPREAAPDPAHVDVPDASPPPAPTKVAAGQAPTPTPMDVRRLEKAVAERLREAVREARAARTEAEETAHQARLEEALREAGHEAVRQASEEPTRRAGSIDPQYIRDAMQAIRPLLTECYELGLAEAEREGEEPPAGRVVMEYVFAGEPDVGGVVEESRVLEDGTTLSSPALAECLQETLYTLELPAPEGGGVITVRYPLAFAPNAQ